MHPSYEQERIRQRSIVNPTTGCWRWSGASRGNGYGAVKVAGKVIDAHRLAWLAFRGAIPAGAMVLHKCDNRSCVNPAHLELGDSSKNRIDAVRRSPIDMKAVRAVRGARVDPISEEEVQTLLANYDGGVSLRQLARRYGIPPTSLRRILTIRGRQLPGSAGQAIAGAQP